MSDCKCRHSGDWEGDLRSRYNHVELGQLCWIMRDVPSDEGVCYMLHVVLEIEKVSDVIWWILLEPTFRALAYTH